MLQPLQSPQSHSGVTAWECTVGSSCLLHFRTLRVEQPLLLLVFDVPGRGQGAPVAGPPSCLHPHREAPQHGLGTKTGEKGIVYLERGNL